MTGVRDYSTGELKHNVVALAKAAKSLKLPIIVTTTARDSMWGETAPTRCRRLRDVESIKIHYLVPDHDKVVNKLLLHIGTSVNFGQRAELRV